MIGRLSVILAVAGALWSCKRADPTPDVSRAEHRTWDARTIPEDAAAPPDASAPHPIFNNCVLHAGNVKVQRRQALFADGGLGPQVVASSCDFNAECSRVKGEFTDGDGSVDMDCIGDSCTCTYLSNSPRSRPFVVPFKSDKPCDSEAQAKAIFTQRCLAGMFKSER